MSNLTDLINQIPSALSKSDLENLYDAFLKLFAEIELTIADLEKAEALFLEEKKEMSVAAAKREFNATTEGLELLKLKRQSKVAEKYVSSVKHKIFANL